MLVLIPVTAAAFALYALLKPPASEPAFREVVAASQEPLTDREPDPVPVVAVHAAPALINPSVGE